MTRGAVQLLIQLLVTAAGTAVCCIFSVPSAAVLVLVSVAIYISSALLRRSEKDRIMKLCSDIDRILRNEEEVLFSEYTEDSIGILSAEIHKMTVRLREQNSALRAEKQFMKEALEDLSHQIRTPLTSALLVLEMMRGPELSKRSRMEYVQELFVLTDRMNWLIETMLGLSCFEAGAVTLRSEEIKCRELIASALEPVSISLELKDIDVKINIEDEPVFTGDRQYFTEALLNILKNCMEHTPSGGCITISAGQNPIYTGIAVSDTGKGFTEEELPHVFDRFYSGKSGSTSSGYGIGLAFARKIVNSQNGSLQAKNAPAGGALFDMRIYSGSAV